MSPHVDKSVSPNRLVFLHGFTQTHHHWHRCAHLISEQLDDDPTLTFVDLPGHGLSDGDRTPISLAGEVLAEDAGAGTYIGYSMGARFALFAGLVKPKSVRRMVLIGANPGIEQLNGQLDRASADGDRADRVIDIGISRFVDEWLSAPMFATLDRRSARVAHRLRNSPSGLASSLRSAGTGAQPSIWHRLPELRMPVLVLAGEYDKKFREIGERLASELPNGAFTVVSDSGHSTPAEQPEQTATIVADWLKSQTNL